MGNVGSYQKASMGSKSLAAAEHDALMIMGYDQDKNQSRDLEEFAYAMSNYAEAVETIGLHELIYNKSSSSDSFSTSSTDSMVFNKNTISLNTISVHDDGSI